MIKRAGTDYIKYTNIGTWISENINVGYERIEVLFFSY